MTKQTLQDKLTTLEAQREQLVANTNAVLGAIQLCRLLLDEFDKDQSSVTVDHNSPNE